MPLFKKDQKDIDGAIKNAGGLKIDSGNLSDTAKNWNAAEGQLVIDVYETDKELVIQSAIAGVKNEDIDISLENDIIIIRGERKNPVKDSKKSYFTQECYFGPFSREIIIPREIDTSRIEANIKDGLLTVRMPKIERAKNKKIGIDG
ncbi:MAG: Hsp20/alpha crystallin family protein [Candidatus Pacebacteria bacterium]|nr:Hsp20/alpha crystallin family protein [Candidatus Paceibacterota bacterium]